MKDPDTTFSTASFKLAPHLLCARKSFLHGNLNLTPDSSSAAVFLSEGPRLWATWAGTAVCWVWGAHHREGVSLEQGSIRKSWAHSQLMFVLQHEQSYQKLQVKLHQNTEGFSCWSAIHISQMTYGPASVSKWTGNQNSPVSYNYS